MTKTQHAVSYLRVSGQGQAGADRDGFARQRAAIATYATRTGLRLVGEYVDVASGTRELDDREGLSDLMARLRSNGVRVVLIERADRLARDLVTGELILAELRKAGVRVIAVDSGADLTAADDDPTRVLIRQVLGAVSQFEKSVIVAKLRAARMRRRAIAGRCEGRKPYGTRPGEAATIGRIRQLRRKPRGGARRSYAAIAAILQAEGYPTRTGAKWHPQTVRGIACR